MTTVRLPYAVENKMFKDTTKFTSLIKTLLLLPPFQGRCSRENCKYLHPPPHLKTQLEINGRNNLIQQKNMAMLAHQMQLANAMMPGTQLPPMVRGHTRMNIPQHLHMVRVQACDVAHVCCVCLCVCGSFSPLLSALLLPQYNPNPQEYCCTLIPLPHLCPPPAHVLSDARLAHKCQCSSSGRRSL